MNAIIRWFAHNHVAANLLVAMLLLGGLLSYVTSINREVFPTIGAQRITVQVPYLGAGPVEVEERIVVPIEEEIYNLQGVKRLTSQAQEGSGTVTIEVKEGFNQRAVLNDVKTRVDAISTFPPESERPIVSEIPMTSEIGQIAVYGDVDAKTLYRQAQRIRDGMAALSDVQRVEFDTDIPPEIAIEVSEIALRKYGLGFDDVARAVRQFSVNLPAGTIRTDGGDITLRTRGQAYTKQDFAAIPVVRRDDGSRVLVGDLAEVKDGFQEIGFEVLYNGKPAHLMRVVSDTDVDIQKTAKAVRTYLQDMDGQLASGVQAEMWWDGSTLYEGRMSLLMANSVQGLILVLVLLMLFLRPGIAGWVAFGLPVAVIGTLIIMGWTGVSLNMITLFCFMLVLGILVDDAIVVGESVHHQMERGYIGHDAAVRGTLAVSGPVALALTTTSLAFTPFLFAPGDFSNLVRMIPIVVIGALLLSYIECMLILPAHLATLKPQKPPAGRAGVFLRKAQDFSSTQLMRFADRVYLPLLDKALHLRSVTLVTFAGIFLLSVVVLASGWVRFSFQPEIAGDFVRGEISLPQGSSMLQARAVSDRVQESVARTSAEMAEEQGRTIVKGMVTAIQGSSIEAWPFFAEPEDGEERVNAKEFQERWRTNLGAIPEADEIRFSAELHALDKPISFELASNNLEQLEAAAGEITAYLQTFNGVFDVRDTTRTSRSELELNLNAQADSLGITLQDVARQVRQGFFGEEAQQIPRGRDDLRVYVRYPRTDREAVETLEEVRVRTEGGAEVPFSSVADADYKQGFSIIRRSDRQRIAQVTADVRKNATDPKAIKKAFFEQKVPELRQRYPDVNFKEGRSGEGENDFLSYFAIASPLSLLAMWGLMAAGLRSYGKALIIMSAIPFGFIGALVGHISLGMSLSMMSVLGIVACAGVVVNDNIVLLSRIDELKNKDGLPLREALLQGCRDRLRPIVLTTLTTFFGLIPIMLETSLQAQFLIPMVVALAFGVLAASAVTLLFVPVCYSAGVSFKRGIKGQLTGLWRKLRAASGQQHPAE